MTQPARSATSQSLAMGWRERHPDSPLLQRALFTACLLGLMLAVLTGCNTTKGVGQDVEAAGDAIQGAAEKAEDELDD